MTTARRITAAIVLALAALGLTATTAHATETCTSTDGNVTFNHCTGQLTGALPGTNADQYTYTAWLFRGTNDRIPGFTPATFTPAADGTFTVTLATPDQLAYICPGPGQWDIDRVPVGGDRDTDKQRAQRHKFTCAPTGEPTPQPSTEPTVPVTPSPTITRTPNPDRTTLAPNPRTTTTSPRVTLSPNPRTTTSAPTRSSNPVRTTGTPSRTITASPAPELAMTGSQTDGLALLAGGLLLGGAGLAGLARVNGGGRRR